MKKIAFCLPLLGLPTLGVFIIPYLEGRGVISFQSDLIGGAIVMFLLPFAIATLFVIVAPLSIPKRIALFFITIVIQFVLVFKLVPPTAETEMIGMAQRYRHEFSAAELQSCADDLLQQAQKGTLTFTNLQRGNLSDMVWQNARVVLNPPLPPNLRGNFYRCSSKRQVARALSNRRGATTELSSYLCLHRTVASFALRIISKTGIGPGELQTTFMPTAG